MVATPLILAVMTLAQFEAGNTEISSFRRSKLALSEVYRDRQVTLYCACPYQGLSSVDHAACGYIPRRPSRRSFRIEWEHVVPASVFGRTFATWREGDAECVDKHGVPYRGRRCAGRVDQSFRYMEADLYNLYPEIGELNDARGNYSMAEVPGESRAFGACDFEIADREVEIADRQVEPRDAIRGDIARAYLYMDAVYPGHGVISDDVERARFESWSSLDPVDANECERAVRIARVQLNVHVITDPACEAAGFVHVGSPTEVDSGGEEDSSGGRIADVAP